MNIKDRLEKVDIEKWAHDTLIYCLVPTLLVFLTTLQTNDFHVALGAAYAALLAAVINLIGKYKSGIDEKDFPVGTKTIIKSTPEEITKTTTPLTPSTEKPGDLSADVLPPQNP